jgi:hypothetical protein
VLGVDLDDLPTGAEKEKKKSFLVNNHLLQ